MPEQLIFDSTAVDASNTPLDLRPADGSIALVSQRFPLPSVIGTYAGTPDMDGDALAHLRYGNRTIDLVLEVWTDEALSDLEHKVAKINREGGTLRRVLDDGTELNFPVHAVMGYEPALDILHENGVTVVPLTLECQPYGYGDEETLTLADESPAGNACVIKRATGVKGDVPGLGRLVLTDAASQDQWKAWWGVQSRYYSAASTGKLFYEAEDLTPLGASVLHAGASGASPGSGTNRVVRNTALTTSYQGIVSTQASGGGAHLSHIGTFRVFARMQVPTSNTGTTTVALEWGVGDFRRFKTNIAQTVDSFAEGVWRRLDLGLVTVPKVPAGTQVWQGRVLAKSTVAGDDIDVDCVWLFPVDEGYGTASAIQRAAAATVVTARDEFDQAAGDLDSKLLPVGGNWATSGSATDLAVEATGHTVVRSTISDASERRAIADTSTLTGTVVQIDHKVTSWAIDDVRAEIIARYVDDNNYLTVRVTGDAISAVTKIAGVDDEVKTVAVTSSLAEDSWHTLKLIVDTGGRLWFWFAPAGGPFNVPTISASSSHLATGGTLAAGEAGFADYNGDSDASTRSFNNFFVYPLVSDAAVFAGQSLEVRHNEVLREDATGALWQPPSQPDGDYLKVPVAGREGRTARFIAMVCRNDPDTMADPALDALGMALHYRPRWLLVPEA